MFSFESPIESQSYSDLETCPETQINLNTERKICSESLYTSVALTLYKVIMTNKSKKHYKEITNKQKKSLFNSKNLVSISLSDYLNRINKYTGLEHSTLIIALIFMDRLCNKQNIILTEHNTYRILFTSIVISIKYNEDLLYNNSYYAKVGGLELKLLNDLEHEFLSIIGFDLYVDKKIYKKYLGLLLANA